MSDQDLQQQARTMATQCLSASLRRLERLVTRHYDTHLAASGVGAVQLPVLTSIYLHPRRTLRQQAELLELERTTLWRNLRPLIAQGLIRAAEGVRPTCYELTAEGLAALETAVAAWSEAHAELLDTLGAVGARKLADSLRAGRRTLGSQTT